MESNEKQCPECSETINASAKKCKYCHTRFIKSGDVDALRLVQVLFIAIGLAMASYFFFFFDTSHKEVHNLGLLNMQQNGVIFGFGLAILGSVLNLLRK